MFKGDEKETIFVGYLLSTLLVQIKVFLVHLSRVSPSATVVLCYYSNKIKGNLTLAYLS